MPNKQQLKNLLDNKVKAFNRPDFILNDPISIPHQFDKLQHIEIMGFLIVFLKKACCSK